MNPTYPTERINAESTPAASIPFPIALPIDKEPVNKLSVPCITSFSPSNSTASLMVVNPALFPFLS